MPSSSIILKFHFFLLKSWNSAPLVSFNIITLILFFNCNEDMGFPWGLSGKESPCQARDMGSIPGLGRSPGEGNGNSFQNSCLGNSMDRVA